MARQRHTAGQIIGKLREVEVGLAGGRKVCRVVPLDRGHGADLLSVACGVWRSEAGSGHLRFDYVLHRLTELFVERWPPDHIRADNGSEFQPREQ
jgi:hypothetical protein